AGGVRLPGREARLQDDRLRGTRRLTRPSAGVAGGAVRVPAQQRVQVERVLDDVILGHEPGRGEDEGPELPAAQRSVSSHLIIEADADILLGIVGAEEDEVPRVLELREMDERAALDGAGRVEAERVRAAEHLDLSVRRDEGAAERALDVRAVEQARDDEADPAVRDEEVVERAAFGVGADVVEAER